MSRLVIYLKSFKKPITITQFKNLLTAGILPFDCCECTPDCDLFVFTNAAQFLLLQAAVGESLPILLSSGLYTQCNTANIYNSSIAAYQSIKSVYKNVNEASIKPECYYEDMSKLTELGIDGIVMLGDQVNCTNECSDAFTNLWTIGSEILSAKDMYGFLELILAEGIVMWKSKDSCCLNLASVNTVIAHPTLLAGVVA